MFFIKIFNSFSLQHYYLLAKLNFLKLNSTFLWNLILQKTTNAHMPFFRMIFKLPAEKKCNDF